MPVSAPTPFARADGQIAAAIQIAAQPKPHHTRSLRLLAWATLKAERGQTICQHRLQAKPVQADRQVA